ncbi:MAG: glycosyltransferase family 2 protein [Candidatus Omnitrophica bacterium]|nr:glycosyltransferase family 2 protein [Candidatus Omnitrophota bacterium]
MNASVSQNVEHSIIVPVHNGRDTLERCVESIRKSASLSSYELIIVDDASTDGTSELAARLGARVIRSEKQRGPGAARNRGAGLAQGSLLVFVDADVLVQTDTLRRIEDLMRNEKGIAVVSCGFDPACEMTDALSRYKHLYMAHSFQGQPRDVYWAFSATMAVRASVFREVGGFDEEWRVLEDEMLGRKISQKGYRVTFQGQLRVRHLRRYAFSDFSREEVRRSRALGRIRMADLLNGTGHAKDNVAPSVKFSLAFFPVIVAGLFSLPQTTGFVAFSLAAFYAANTFFLSMCRRYCGTGFMFRAAGILLLDCLLCWCGILAALSDLVRSKGSAVRENVAEREGEKGAILSEACP